MPHAFRNKFVPAAALALLALGLTTCSSNGFHPDIDRELIRLSALDKRDFPSVLANLGEDDSIAMYYRDPTTKRATRDFFASLTNSLVVADAILENADRYSVPPSLAFALAYEESKFAVDAINRNGDSVDRGLFQLNSNSFPKLGVSSFYDPRVNARYALAHLQYLLRQAGNEVSALAMYNAGNASVTKGRTPQKTLDYVSRILRYQMNITSLFAAKVIAGPRLKEAAIRRERLSLAGLGLSAQ